MTLISRPTAWMARTADSRPAPGPSDPHFDFFKTVPHGLAAGVLRDHLRGVGGALARALEATLAGAGPADRRSIHVRDRDDGVVKRCDDMRDARMDVLAALRLDDLDLLDDGVRIEGEILFLLRLRSSSGGGVLFLGSLGLGRAFGAASAGAAAAGAGAAAARQRELLQWRELRPRPGLRESPPRARVSWNQAYAFSFLIISRPWRLSRAGRRPSCAGPSGCGHWSRCAGRARATRGGGGCRDSN